MNTIKFIILEMQTNDEGIVATLVSVKDNYDEAYSAYYLALAGAASSALRTHSVILTNNSGIVMEHKAFYHGTDEPEETEEETE